MTGTPGGTRPCSSTLARMSSAAPWAGRPVAIVHDWFQGYHGAERVVEAIADDVLDRGEPGRRLHLPRREGSAAAAAGGADRAGSRAPRDCRALRQVGHDPGRWRYLLPLHAPLLPLARPQRVRPRRRLLALRARSTPRRRRARPASVYCHTPMRYAWLADTERRAASAASVAGLSAGSSGWLRQQDRAAAQRPDRLIGELDRGPRPHPPLLRPRGGRRPSAGRGRGAARPSLPQERRPASSGSVGSSPTSSPLLVAEAFRGLPQRLDDGRHRPPEEELRARLPDNVELRGWISARASWTRSTASAAGFIHVGEEDFGITMVEALAAGAPVIAPTPAAPATSSATAVDGVLLAEPSVDALRDAVDRASRRPSGTGRRSPRAPPSSRGPASSPRCGSSWLRRWTPVQRPLHPGPGRGRRHRSSGLLRGIAAEHGDPTLLDVGCWDGESERAAAATPSAPSGLLGVEVYEEPGGRSRSEGPGGRPRRPRNRPLPWEDGSVDVVVCNQVLEHLKNIWLPMTEMHRVLRPGGHAVLSVPNLASLHNRVLLALGRQPTSDPRPRPPRARLRLQRVPRPRRPRRRLRGASAPSPPASTPCRPPGAARFSSLWTRRRPHDRRPRPQDRRRPPLARLHRGRSRGRDADLLRLEGQRVGELGELRRRLVALGEQRLLDLPVDAHAGLSEAIPASVAGS